MSLMKLVNLFVIVTVLVGHTYGRPIGPNKSDSGMTAFYSILGIFIIIVVVGIPLAIYCLCRKSCGYERLESAHRPKKNDKIKDGYDSDEAPTGIVNTGDSCYLNAVLQALASSGSAVNKFNNFTLKSDKLDQLVSILKDINTIGQDPVNLSKEVEKLLKMCEWKKEMQQDSFDLLSHVMNSVDRSLSNFENPLKVQLMTMFESTNYVNKKQTYFGFSIPLPDKCMDSKLVDMFNKFFEPSYIDDDPNHKSWFELVSDDTPNVLLLHIQANQYDPNRGVMFKPKYRIDFNTEMEFEIPLHNEAVSSEPRKIKSQYRLVSMVVHKGSISFGHYITIRKFRGSWFLINDCSVKSIPEKNVKTMVPYLLFYEKM